MQNSVIILMYNSRVSLRTNKDLNNNNDEKERIDSKINLLRKFRLRLKNVLTVPEAL